MDDVELLNQIRQIIREEIRPPESFIRLREVERLSGFKQSTIHKLIRKKQFPDPIKMVGDKRVSVWVRSEVEKWVMDQIIAYRIPYQRRSPYLP